MNDEALAIRNTLVIGGALLTALRWVIRPHGWADRKRHALARWVARRLG